MQFAESVMLPHGSSRPKTSNEDDPYMKRGVGASRPPNKDYPSRTPEENVKLWPLKDDLHKLASA